MKLTYVEQRRCIHDEYGRVDPIKAQERSKPRGTASSKRPRPNEDEAAPPSTKKSKQESISPITHPVHFAGNAETTVVPQDVPGIGAGAYDAVSHLQAQPSNVAEVVTVGQALYASPPVLHVDSVDIMDAHAMSVSSKPTTSLVSPPTSLADDMDVVQDGEPLASVEGEASTALHTPNSSSRHSSRQPRHVERFVPEATAPRPSKHVSSSTLRRTTPGPSSSARKPLSRPSSSHAKKSSPMVEKRFERHATTSLSPHQSKHGKHRIEDDADAESLRLIRELQEEEFGLRRRRG